MAQDAFQLRLYDTLRREKVPFVPLDPANVRMYVCGPTVYDYAHIGNARPVIVFDVLYRLLKHLYPGPGGAPDGSRVTYVRNITDVDDKINARAARDFPGLPLNEAIRQLTEKTAAQFEKDVTALGCLKPTSEPRATENIAEMIRLIQRLLDRGHAYAATGAEGREVLFDVTSMPDYGELSKRPLEEQQAGARVAVEAHKKNPGDFVLWKESGADEPGWPAEFRAGGETLTIFGRPGWHIECSAMSDKFLWELAADRLSPAAQANPHVFDIHGGGIDLAFPHHENEIAQTRSAFGTRQMAQVWMHNGFLQVEGQKMSKSLGNFVTINELLETEKFGGRRWPGEVLRLAMLMTHYREPIDFSVARLEEAESVLDSWYRAVGDIGPEEGRIDQSTLEPLLDDLGTTGAVAALHELRAEAARGSAGAVRLLKASASLLGLLQTNATAWFSGAAAGEMSAEAIEAAIARRLDAIAAKDFAKADAIRAELSEKGIQLMDYKDPETGERRTRWEVKR